jgi:hypothetical protein
VTPLTSLVVVIPNNGSEGGVSELVRDHVDSSTLDPDPFLESATLQNKISKLFIAINVIIMFMIMFPNSLRHIRPWTLGLWFQNPLWEFMYITVGLV